MRLKPLLEVRELTVAYKVRDTMKYAVKNVSFTLGEDEVLAIVGESGSGKSTIALSIVGALPENAVVVRGKILFKGVDLLRLRPSERRDINGKEISIIYQDPIAHLNPLRKVKLIFKDLFEDHGVEFNIQKVLELLRKLKVPDPQRVLESYPFQLSGGMAQRVFIALALVLNPKLLIADEPTSALDLTIQAQVVRLLREVRENFRISMIIITHDIGVATSIADRILVMCDGELVEEGSPEEVLLRPKSKYTANLVNSTKTLYEGVMSWVY
jgi:peptide/nickel transport system ATP-binding protein